MICNQEKCIHIIKKVELEKQLFELRNKPIPADKPETSDRIGCKNYGTIGNCAACHDYRKCDRFEAIVVQPKKECDCPSCEMTDRAAKAETANDVCHKELSKIYAEKAELQNEIAKLKERLAECYDNPHAGSQRDLQIKLDQTTAACKKFNDNLTIAVDRMKAAEAKLAEYENFVKDGVKECDHYQKEAEKWRAQFCKMADLYIDMNEKWRNK